MEQLLVWFTCRMDSQTGDGRLWMYKQGTPPYTSIITHSVAELIFGTSMGMMRSEMDLKYTTAFMPPQVFETVNDGDIISGGGFTTDIFTECTCSAGRNVSDVVGIAGHLGSAETQRLVERFEGLSVFGFSNHVLRQGEEVVVTSLFSQTSLCGGIRDSFIPGLFCPLRCADGPVCVTKLSNHQTAKIAISYMSDGSGYSFIF